VLLLALIAAAVRLSSEWQLVFGLKQQVERLSGELADLRRQLPMPSAILLQHRESICYLYAEYELRAPQAAAGEAPVRLRLSGTGFVVARGLIASNKHVLQPQFESPQARALVRRGAVPRAVRLLAFFPQLPRPVILNSLRFSPSSDLALSRFSAGPGSEPQPLTLASVDPIVGAPVLVVGYPFGLAGVLAKSPSAVRERLAAAGEGAPPAMRLASLSLLRPTATCGHVGDVVGETLIYDAATAQGSSGGPVFNGKGEVVAVNSAYVVGFSGGSLGISVRKLKDFIATTR
jgi:S1-C subfamily serine protease